MRRALIPILLVLAFPAAAQAPRDELGRIEAEQRQREARRDEHRRDAQDTRREIAELTAQLAELNAAQGEGRQMVGERRLRLAAVNAREAQLTARMGANRNELSRLLGALQSYSRNPPPALFVNPRDARNAVRAAILVRAVTPELQNRADDFAAQADQIKRARREAAAAAGGVFTAESDIAERAAQIEAVLVQKTALERSLITEAVITDQQIAHLSARAAALRAVLKGLPATPAPRTTLASLVAPVAGPPSRRFGVEEPTGGVSEGWAWQTAAGSAVFAPGAGIVEFAGPVSGWDHVVIIAVGGGHHLVLSGLEAATATPGQSVAVGQSIGRMATGGNMGLRSSGPELRLEIRKNGQAVDPARFLKER